MKRVFNEKVLFGLILGILISATVVYAIETCDAINVLFEPSNGLTSRNLQAAIDEVYQEAKNGCPQGYICTLQGDSNVDTYTIILNANGGTEGSTYATVAYGATSVPEIVNPTKSGYNFLGWYSEISDGVKVMNSDGTLVAGVNSLTDSEGKWIGQSITSLYARWELKKYIIHYNLLYSVQFTSSNSVGRSEITYGSTSISKINVSNDGYELGGWYTRNIDGSFGTKVADANGKLYYEEGSIYVNSEKKWIYDGKGDAIELYTKWKPTGVLKIVQLNDCSTADDSEVAFELCANKYAQSYSNSGADIPYSHAVMRFYTNPNDSQFNVKVCYSNREDRCDDWSDFSGKRNLRGANNAYLHIKILPRDDNREENYYKFHIVKNSES